MPKYLKWKICKEQIYFQVLEVGKLKVTASVDLVSGEGFLAAPLYGRRVDLQKEVAAV